MARFPAWFLAAVLLVPRPVSAQQNPVQPSKAPLADASGKPAGPASVAHPLEKADLEAFFDGIVPLQMGRSDVAGAVVLVMKNGQVLLKKGYGYSDLKKKQSVDPDTTMFRLASISKPFTWISVMQLAEQGKLDIDQDINKYLDFQIAPAFGKPVTLRNLMTHTGGFEEEVRDIILTDPQKAMPLRQFLAENQPRRMYPPGEVPAYSNYGVGLGGYVVERVSGQSFADYVRDHIFLPLGMTHSSFDEPLRQELQGRASEGYKKSTEDPVMGFEIFNPAPAGGVSSSARDMGRFAEALLGGGELEGRRILKPETLGAMWTRQFAASDALPAMCMGFYETWRNGLRFVGHDGDLVAFHSRFLVEPKEKLVLFLSYNSAGSAAKSRGEILNLFLDRYYPYTPAPPLQTLPAGELKAIEGTYQTTRREETTKLKLGELLEQGHAKVDKDGVLKIDISRDLRGHVRKWKAVGQDLWQAEEDQSKIFAIRGKDGRIVRLAVDFPGVQVERVPWYENARFIGVLFSLAMATLLSVVLATLGRLSRRIFMSGRPALKPQPGTAWLGLGTRTAAFLWVFLAIGAAVLLGKLDGDGTLPTRALDKYFVMINVAAALAMFASLFAVVAGVRVWFRPELRTITRVKFSVVLGACLFLTWFSIHWNILGPAHRF